MPWSLSSNNVSIIDRLTQAINSLPPVSGHNPVLCGGQYAAAANDYLPDFFAAIVVNRCNPAQAVGGHHHVTHLYVLDGLGASGHLDLSA